MVTSDWLALLNSIATLSAAAGATFITYKIGKSQREISARQADTAAVEAQTAKNALKLELFERRVAVYDAALKAIDSTALMNYQREEVQKAYKAGIEPAIWLFPQEVLDYLNSELLPLLVEFGVTSRDAEFCADEEEKTSAIRRESYLRIELMAQGHRLNEVFAPHLRLES